MFCVRTKRVALLPLGNGVLPRSTSFIACIITLCMEEQGSKTVEVTEVSQAAIQRKIFIYKHILSSDMFILQSRGKYLDKKKKNDETNLLLVL